MAYLIITGYHGAERGIESYTLLGRFIQEKLDSYIEPERKGTAKGDEIGFSRKKYEASLYNITNLKMKYLSKTLNISYGLLRKWRTEDTFRAMIERHSREFASRFCEYVETIAKERLRSEEAGKDHGGEEHEEVFAAVNDGRMYGSRLCEEIRGILEERIAGIEKRQKRGVTNSDDDAFLGALRSVLMTSQMDLRSKLKFFVGFNNEFKEIREARMLRAKEQGATIIEDPIKLCRKALDREKLSDDEKEQAIVLFQHLLEAVKD